MKRKRAVGWSALILGALLIAIQFVPVARVNPPVKSDLQASPEVKEILRGACYDCHSHETRWPWYSRIAPLSWWLADHIREGRADLNFSQWPLLDFEAQADALEDIAAQIKKGKMPLRSYRLAHPEARLDARQKGILLDWAGAGSE